MATVAALVFRVGREPAARRSRPDRVTSNGGEPGRSSRPGIKQPDRIQPKTGSSLPTLPPEFASEFGFRVVEVGGSPIPGATVVLHRTESLYDQLAIREDEVFRGVADEAGRVRASLPGPMIVTALIRATGYVPRTLAALFAEPRERRVELARGREVVLSVQDRAGNPVPAVEFVTLWREGTWRDAKKRERLDSGIASDGRIAVPYPLTRVAGRTLIVSLVARGFRATQWRHDMAEPPTDSIVVMDRGVEMTGVVLGGPGGPPVSNALVTSGAGRWRVRTRTDRNGRFRHVCESPETPVHELIVLHPGYAPTRHSVKAEDAGARIVIALKPGLRKDFRFRDAATGEPAAVDRVTVYGIDVNVDAQECRISDDRTAAIITLERDCAYRAVVEAAGYATAYLGVCRARTAKDPHPVRLHRGRTWRGLLRSRGDGQPVEGAVLVGLWTNILVVDEDTCSRMLRKERHSYSVVKWRSGTVAADGSFAIPGLAPGRYDLRIRLLRGGETRASVLLTGDTRTTLRAQGDLLVE